MMVKLTGRGIEHFVDSDAVHVISVLTGDAVAVVKGVGFAVTVSADQANKLVDLIARDHGRGVVDLSTPQEEPRLTVDSARPVFDLASLPLPVPVNEGSVFSFITNKIGHSGEVMSKRDWLELDGTVVERARAVACVAKETFIGQYTADQIVEQVREQLYDLRKGNNGMTFKAIIPDYAVGFNMADGQTLIGRLLELDGVITVNSGTEPRAVVVKD